MTRYAPAYRIAPSILSADFARLGQEVADVIEAGADWIHFDVMDNHYVPNLTVGPLVCKAIRPCTKAPIDVHLTIGLIRECGARPGLVFNPSTPLACLEYELDKIDMILLMSVNPGFGGQKFIPGTLAKIRAVRALVERHFEQTGHEVLIEVDGGIKPANIAEVAQAGANVFVAGSAIYGAGDKAGYARQIAAMRQALAVRC